MAQVTFTKNLQRHLTCPTMEKAGATVREVLDGIFAEIPNLESYLLDDQGRLRKHVNIFVEGNLIKDRDKLTDRVEPDGRLHVIQALSGG